MVYTSPNQYGECDWWRRFLLGAYVASRLAGKCPLESMRFGISAAVISIEQDAVRRRNLNTEEVNAKISDMKIEEKTL